MSFLTRQNRNIIKPPVKFNNLDIPYKLKSTFLGIYITENMNWNVNLQSISSKLSKVCYITKPLKEVMAHMTQTVAILLIFIPIYIMV
jgi:hypothetical protein